MADDFLLRLLNPQASNGWNPFDDRWYTSSSDLVGGPTLTTAETALRIGAVFACVRVLAETMLSVPVVIYRRLPGGGREPAPEHPIYSLLHDEPNADQTAGEFKEMLTGHTALRGTSYAKIIPGDRGFASRLDPIHPDRVTPRRNTRGMRIWEISDPTTGGKENLLDDELFRLPGMSFNGVTGLSVVAHARESFGLARSLEVSASRMYRNGVRPSGVLKHPTNLSEPAGQRLRRQFEAYHAGEENFGKALLLEEGMDWASVGMTFEDAQWIDAMKFKVQDVARWFRVPPHLVQDLERATFSNIEHQSIDFVVFTMLPWFMRWEQRILKQLLTPGVFGVQGDYFAEVQSANLLRGDTKTRFEAYNMAINGGWMSRQEIRRLENLNPGPRELDTFLQPGNMNPAGYRPPEGNSRPGAVLDGVDPRTRTLATQVASGIATKEVDRIAKAARQYAADPAGWEAWARDFYVELADEIARRCYVPPAAAEAYAQAQLDRLLEAGAQSVDRDAKAAALLELTLGGILEAA